MVAAIILSVSCLFGTWIAWRRHPLYTRYTALRIAGGTLLLIAATAGVIALAVWLTPARSDTALFASILCALVVGTLGMTYGITAVVTPPCARLNTRLPPDVTALNLHRRALRRWWLPTLAFFGICALLASIPGVSHDIAAALAFGAGTFVVIAAPARYLMARRLDRAVTALTLNPWLHWRYSPEARSAWIDVQFERRRAMRAPTLNWRMAWWVCCPIMVAGTMLIADGAWIIRAACGIGLCALVLVVLKITEIAARRQPYEVARRMRAAPPDAYFGHDGVFADDRFLTWIDTKQHLVSATLDERPPRSIALVFKQIKVGGYAGPLTVTLRQEVLVPATAGEADLVLLRSALNARCPSAHVQL